MSDIDLLILPVTVDTSRRPWTCGGSVTIIRRWTKGKIKQMARRRPPPRGRRRALRRDVPEEGGPQDRQAKENLKAAGIKGRGKHAFGLRDLDRI
jgi:hypothetical protein